MLKRLAFFVLSLSLIAVGPAHAVSAQSITGRWTGSYVCAQGQTWLQLDIKYNAGDWVDARFTFGFYNSDNDSDRGPAEGAFHQDGKVIGDHLHLKGDYWYQAKEGYGTVDLDGDFSADGRTFSGTVSGADGCETFSVTRR